MRFGVTIPQFLPEGGPVAIGPALAASAHYAEAAGLASLWVMDHFFQIPPVGPVDDPMLEGYSALAYAAAATERISLGTLVTGVAYRHPGILVKTVTTLDVLSGGRAVFGIGAGWFEREHDGLGVRFPPVAERFERLEETILIAKQMWSGETGSFDGRHYRLAETLCRPLPLSRPHPPIMIGGGGERKTLRLVARYADACNLAAQDLEEVRHKLDVLRGHCAAEGRPYEAIEKTTISGPVTRSSDPRGISLEQTLGLLDGLQSLGVDQHIFGVAAGDEETIDIIANELMPRFA